MEAVINNTLCGPSLRALPGCVGASVVCSTGGQSLRVPSCPLAVRFGAWTWDTQMPEGYLMGSGCPLADGVTLVCHASSV